jgi:hypothetical protein
MREEMVKSTIALIVVLIIIFGASYFENKYIKSKFEYFDKSLDEIIADTENKTDASEKLDSLIDWWKKEKHILHAFIPHNEIRELDGIMTESKSFIKSAYFDSAAARLKKLDDLIISIPDNYSFSLGNIF